MTKLTLSVFACYCGLNCSVPCADRVSKVQATEVKDQFQDKIVSRQDFVVGLVVSEAEGKQRQRSIALFYDKDRKVCRIEWDKEKSVTLDETESMFVSMLLEPLSRVKFAEEDPFVPDLGGVDYYVCLHLFPTQKPVFLYRQNVFKFKSHSVRQEDEISSGGTGTPIKGEFSERPAAEERLTCLVTYLLVHTKFFPIE